MPLVARFPLIKDKSNMLDPSFNLTGTFLPSENSQFGGAHTLTNTLSGTIPELVDISNFTVTFWIYCSSTYITNTDWINCLAIYTKNTENDTSGSLRFQSCYSFNPPRAVSIHNNNSYDYASEFNNSGIIVSDKDKWHHVAVSADGTNVKCYCDGVLVNSSPEIGGTPRLTGAISIGNTNYNGQMNDLRFYNEALDSYEIKKISQGLMLHYDFGNLPQLNYFSNQAGSIYTPSNVTNSCLNVGVADYTKNTFTEDQTFTISFDLIWDGMDNSSTAGTFASWFQGSVYSVADSKYIWTAGNRCTDALKVKYNLTNIFTEKSSGTLHCVASYVCDTSRLASYTKEYVGIRCDFSNGTGWVRIFNMKVVLGNSESFGEISSSNIISTDTMYDSSDFGNNGTVNGNIISSTTSPIGNGSIKLKGYCGSYIYNANFPKLQKLTYNVWANTLGETSLNQFIMSMGRDAGMYGINVFLTPDLKPLFRIGNSTQKYTFTNTAPVDVNTWHMYSIAYDGETVKFYFDGTLCYQNELSSIDYSQSSGLVIGKMSFSRTSANLYFPFNGLIADPRVYCSALSDNDIITLYKTRKAISRNGNIFANTFLENNNISKNGITSRGIQKTNVLSEAITLSDGSKWLRLMHHDTKYGTNLFSNTDDFENSIVYHNQDCWCAFNFIKKIASNNTLYEFLVVQEEGTEYKKYRWSQTVNPLTATFEQTVHANITPILNIPNAFGGIYKLNGYCFMCANNGKNGNWFGFGSSLELSGGVPAYNSARITGFYDLYIRITENIEKEAKNGILFPNNIALL